MLRLLFDLIVAFNLEFSLDCEASCDTFRQLIGLPRVCLTYVDCKFMQI